MKNLILVTCFSVVALQILNAKGSLSTNEAFRKYRNNEPVSQEGGINPQSALGALLKRDQPASPEEVLPVLSSIRGNPSKELIDPLKELWKLHHERTFRTTEPDDWTSIKTEDYAQMLCDEIKILVNANGGNIDDIEPLDERNTSSLNAIRTSMRKIKDAPDQVPPPVELHDMAKKLLEVVKTCNFDALNDDQKLQLIYLFDIVGLLADEKVWPNQNAAGVADPIIGVFDEGLSKALTRIDNNWVQQPTGSSDQEPPTIEQTIQWRKNSLQGYQQMNLRRIRDQILLNVSKLIKARPNDRNFEQAMMQRFAKNPECRTAIESHLRVR